MWPSPSSPSPGEEARAAAAARRCSPVNQGGGAAHQVLGQVHAGEEAGRWRCDSQSPPPAGLPAAARPLTPPAGFGTVRQCHTHDGTDYAVKVMHLPKPGEKPPNDGATYEEIMNEVQVLAKVSHPNCLEMMVRRGPARAPRSGAYLSAFCPPSPARITPLLTPPSPPAGVVRGGPQGSDCDRGDSRDGGARGAPPSPRAPPRSTLSHAPRPLSPRPALAARPCPAWATTPRKTRGW